MRWVEVEEEEGGRGEGVRVVLATMVFEREIEIATAM